MTESPVLTYFGPGDTPLFGVLHVPVPTRGGARGGVLICPPLGKEQGDTTRGQKLLAERLADRGLATLRFDYLHTGESWGDQTDPAAGSRMVDSVRHALALLRSAGVSRIAVVGLRMGALIAAQLEPDELASLAGLVLWDPVVKGSTWVRAEKLLYQTAFADDAEIDGLVHLVGASWHSDTIADLRRLKVPATIKADLGGRIAVATHAPDVPGVAPLVESGVEVLPIPDPVGFVKPESYYVTLPVDAVAAITDWLDARFDAAVAPCSLVARPEQVLTPTGSDRPVRTRVIRDEQTGIVRWETAPADGATPHQVLLLHATANDIRTGPGRVWVDLAREVAAHGTLVVRHDHNGVGESSAVNQVDDYLPIHDPSVIDDAARVSSEYSGVRAVHAGVCSGAWVATQLADKAPDSSEIVLINHLMWRLDPAPLDREDILRMGIVAPTDVATPVKESFYFKYRGRIQPIVTKVLPFWAWKLLGRLRLVQVPDNLLTDLARKDIATRLVFAESDDELFVKQRGDDSLEALARRGWTPEVVVTAGGDHAGFHWRVREASRQEILRALGIDSTGAAPAAGRTVHHRVP